MPDLRTALEDALAAVPADRATRVASAPLAEQRDPLAFLEHFALKHRTSLGSLVFYPHDGVVPPGVMAGNPAFSALETVRVRLVRSPIGESLPPRDDVVRPGDTE